MNALRIAVERIVRPLRSSQRRKDRIRAELYSHIVAAYEEERASGVDEAEAAARAARRLGDPETVTRTLQATVPAGERILFFQFPLPGRLRTASEQWMGPRPNESAAAWAVRITFLTFALPMSVFSFLIIPILKASRWSAADFKYHFTFGFSIWLMVSLAMFLFYLVVQLIAHAAGEISDRRRAFYMFASGAMMSLCVMGVGLLSAYFGRERMEFAPAQFYTLVAGAIVALVVTPIVGALHSAEARRWRYWESLDLTEESGERSPQESQGLE